MKSRTMTYLAAMGAFVCLGLLMRLTAQEHPVHGELLNWAKLRCFVGF